MQTMLDGRNGILTFNSEWRDCWRGERTESTGLGIRKTCDLLYLTFGKANLSGLQSLHLYYENNIISVGEYYED